MIFQKSRGRSVTPSSTHNVKRSTIPEFDLSPHAPSTRGEKQLKAHQMKISLQKGESDVQHHIDDAKLELDREDVDIQTAIQLSLIGQEQSASEDSDLAMALAMSLEDDNEELFAKSGGEKRVYALAPRGLRNVGNSCYINALMQCLAAIGEVQLSVLHSDHRLDCPNKTCMVCLWEDTIEGVQGLGNPLRIELMTDWLAEFNLPGGKLIRNQANDPGDFFNTLLTRMEDVGVLYLTDLFTLDVPFEKTCPQCKMTSCSGDNHSRIGLELPIAPLHIQSVVNALDDYFQPAIMDGENAVMCEQCQRRTSCIRTSFIMSAPKLLMIQLVRSSAESKTISYTKKLDLAPWMKSNVKTVYELNAVILFWPRGVNGTGEAHYTAYVRVDGKWYHADDANVSKLPKKQFTSPPVNSYPCILFGAQWSGQ